MPEPQILEQISDHTWTKVEEITTLHPDIPLTRVDPRGYAADELIEYAEPVEAEMLVVRNRGYGPIRSAILGSTSHRVAQQCPRDVLIVRS